ncbi:hypothetical protein HYH03_004962 [Edaphochlamys debaryana]|uniref:Uncharacterized protein n=1 Tax=Edaphochlamys debaryana TaxID=47281 RepID=A0A835Y9Z8_9CHLO|nr:hypothetical protein HYH03_004962 [Edaphochlamys debaryana]|eukprot:KAG2496956.1 hypothetical protein HYH03_004962 [Edaphochlamys debaryana]
MNAVPLGLPGFRLRPMYPHEHQEVIDADSGIYDTPAVVALSSVRQWCGQVPAMGFVVETERGQRLGVCSLIPAAGGSFRQMAAGELREADMHGEHVFDAWRHDEIGVHMYHMERVEGYPRGVPDMAVLSMYGMAHALREVQELRQALGRPGPLRVCGVSGLAVSPQGIRLTVILYGARERSYICPEHVLRAPKGPGGGKRRLELHTLHTQEQLEALLGAGYELVARCRHLVLYSHEPSFLWTIVPRVLGPEGGAGGAPASADQPRREPGGAVGGSSCSSGGERRTGTKSEVAKYSRIVKLLQQSGPGNKDAANKDGNTTRYGAAKRGQAGGAQALVQAAEGGEGSEEDEERPAGLTEGERTQSDKSAA